LILAWPSTWTAPTACPAARTAAEDSLAAAWGEMQLVGDQPRLFPLVTKLGLLSNKCFSIKNEGHVQRKPLPII